MISADKVITLIDRLVELALRTADKMKSTRTARPPLAPLVTQAQYLWFAADYTFGMRHGALGRVFLIGSGFVGTVLAKRLREGL